ncbi:MAG: 4Fe-4S binding protein [Planctomycetaceae bacterium]|nr:4Fe-4S binding protein [Planctomycetaceae bacterium]
MPETSRDREGVEPGFGSLCRVVINASGLRGGRVYCRMLCPHGPLPDGRG